MIKRAEAERDPWSGHIACPGGRMDPGDRDLEHTAIRETWEETGVDLARDGVILGTLDDISPRTPSLPPMIIRPFVAVVKPDITIVESIEVAEVFWVPLAAIRETEAWGTGLVRIRGVGRPRGGGVPPRRLHGVGANASCADSVLVARLVKMSSRAKRGI